MKIRKWRYSTVRCFAADMENGDSPPKKLRESEKAALQQGHESLRD
ncbi:hypothetical protein Kole_1239 [Kosmotoga olearia TBF 19.5.1]|uniref:Uncharacterized protein n=1 Tax=Kosmotoga olearia (strain ATCC BAA-1733 / DSM 21960 / TBF 19.5.1) TaxID=521045 RepID=C5CJ20_KOSOT|nr:hypothetical protein Kole_1239 [Kosmotoga olearia TBF 19.5.1]